jgi:capsular exopolysaccharide synthesis family protein
MSVAEQNAGFFRRAVESLKGRIIVEPIRDTDLFIIRVQDYSPVGAAITANTVSRSYVIFDLEQQLAELQQKYGDRHQAVLQLRDHIARMAQTLNGRPIPNIEAIGPATVKIVEQAAVPIEPAGRSKPLLLLVAAVCGALLGIILAFVFDALDQTIRTPQEAARMLGVAHLGSIPTRRWGSRPVMQDPGQAGTYARAYQGLADQLSLLTKEQQLKSILLTATLRSEGTTTALANVGKCLAARSRKKVLLIDANFHDASLHRVLGLPGEIGLAEVLDGRLELSRAIRPVEPGLFVLQAGMTPRDAMALLDSPAMAQVLKQVAEQFDVVLIDGANLKDFRDSAVISMYADGVALVVREGMARRQVIEAALVPLERAKAKLLGTILNRRRFVIPKVIYDLV